MPGEEAHRGSETPGFNTVRGDARIERITDLLLEADPVGQSAHRPIRDHTRSLQLLQQRTNRSNPWSIGTVAHAVPHVNWYKVQMADNGGWLGCCRLVDTNCLPIGPRVGNVIASGSRVLVWKPTNADFGVIVGVLPHILEDPRVAVSGWLAQGAATGLKREDAHRQLFKGMFRSGGVHDFSCQSPVDATSMDHVLVTETGLAFLMSPFELFLRVNEMCGVWFNYFDSQTTLAGWNMVQTSAAHELYAGHDEGETRYRNMVAVYPWEAAGLYGPDSDMAADFDAEEVQYKGHKGAVDLPDDGEDATPVYRTQEFKGYEGQGGLRAVIKPAANSGVRRLSDSDLPDTALFCESVSLDGEYHLQSAKGIFITKRSKMSWPRQKHADESPKGDDASVSDDDVFKYKPSSQFGGGVPHVLGDVKAQGERRSLLKVSGVQDLIAHSVNWKRLHPFHYRFDYTLPQESEQGTPFPRVSDPLDFSEVAESGYLSEPEPVMLRIDHRYGEVEYYMRESFLAFLDDGTVVLAGGAGEELAFVNGKVKLSAPSDVEILPGKDLIAQCSSVIVKAQRSVDVSASKNDVRIWAHENLQIGAKGTVLIDGQGEGTQQDYKDKIGEDVRGGGVVIKSKADVALIGKEAYVRSTQGDVVLDAAKMDGHVLILASNVSSLITGNLSVYHFSGIDGSVVESHRLARTTSFVAQSCAFGGSVYAGVDHPAQIVVVGGIRATRSIASGGRMADSTGGKLGKVQPSFVSDIEEAMQNINEASREIDEQGDDLKKAKFEDKWHKSKRIGNDEVIEDVGFSYRDHDSPGKQYGTENLRFLESRWQTLARIGGASGGETWTENPVSYQGRQLYPWPGRERWTGSGYFLRVSEYTMYDAGGYDRDRAGPYEEAKLGGEEKTSLQEGVKITRT
jgi:hypothetical protein